MQRLMQDAWKLSRAAMLLALVACADRVMAPVVRAETAAASAVRTDALRDGVARVAPMLADTGQATALTRALTELQSFLEAGRMQAAAVQLGRVRSRVRAAHAADLGAMAADLSVIEMALDDVDESLHHARSRRVSQQPE